AVWAGTTQRQAEVLKHVPPDRAVVVYCSVGWRSAEVVARLAKGGKHGVLNLDGSIFQWANEGRSLIDSRAEPVRVVHPFNRAWGSLLERSLWSHVPPS
ncbi:MAG: rhodanese-like domain-containing protein, partial [Opitutaceae bacterium]